MDKAMTIEEFDALMTSDSEKDDSPLLTALRSLTTIEKPEDIRALVEDDVQGWTDWKAV